MVASNESFCESKKAVLFYGSRKAGTTLLQNLFDGGDDLIVYPYEMKLKYLIEHPGGCSGSILDFYLSIQGDDLKKNVRKLLSDSSSILSSPLQGFDIENYARSFEKVGSNIDNLSDLISYDIDNFCKSSRLSNAYTHWGCKEVGGNPGEVTSFFCEMFPEAKIVIILRNPFDIAVSIIRDRLRRKIKLSPFKKIKESYIAWRQLGRYSLGYNCNALYVSYEDLSNKELSEYVVEKISKYLGIEMNSIFLYPTILGVGVVVKTSSIKEKGIQFNDGLKWYRKIGLLDASYVFMGYLISVFWWVLNKGKLPNYNKTKKKLC